MRHQGSTGSKSLLDLKQFVKQFLLVFDLD
jgi:hypothetical protein